MPKPEYDLEKLLGGFATDTLTAEERDTIFRAALQDQHLFNALADEQALKELLADPAVRGRLLQSLAEHREASRWQSWLKQFTQPAGLAWAGGIAAGVFAVVLGFKVYEDSLRQASETAVLEEVKPSVPSTPPAATVPDQAPLPKTMEKAPKGGPPAKPTRKDELTDTARSRELDAASRRKEKAAPEVNETEQRASVQKQEMKTKEFQKMDSPVVALGKSSGQQTPSSGERPLAPPTPTAEPQMQPMRPQSSAPLGSAASKKVGARALFYGMPGRREASGLSNYAPSSTERQQEKIGNLLQEGERRDVLAEKAETPTEQRILGLRISHLNYSASTEQTFKVEGNQPGYLLIWSHNIDGITILYPTKRPIDASTMFVEGHKPLTVLVPPQKNIGVMKLYFGRLPLQSLDDDSLRRMPWAEGKRFDMERSIYAEPPETEDATYYVTADPSVVLSPPTNYRRN